MQHSDDKAETYYKILGIAPDASTAEIKKGYYKSALAYHPDKNKDEGAEERFKLISEANEVLTDPGKKLIYDSNLLYGHAYAKAQTDPRGVQEKKPEIDPTPHAQKFLSELENQLKNIAPEVKRKSWFSFGKEPFQPVTELKKLFNNYPEWQTNANTIRQQLNRVYQLSYLLPSDEKNNELDSFYQDIKTKAKNIYDFYPRDRSPARMPPQKRGGMSGWS